MILADVDEARAAALKGAREMLAEDIKQGSLDLDGRIEVTDEDGAIVVTVTFVEAAGLEGLQQ